MYNIFFYKLPTILKKTNPSLPRHLRPIFRDKTDLGGGILSDELEKQLFTSEEIAESEVRVAIINEMIKAREENGITQKQLEAMSGIKQPVISRMENGTSDPQLSTVLKILNSLGKTLQIVPMK